MSDLHSITLRMSVRGVTIRLDDSRGHYQRRVTYQQMAGMLRKLRAEGDAQIPGVPEREYGVLLTDTRDGGLALVLTGKGAPRVGRGHMTDLDRVESAMGRVAA